MTHCGKYDKTGITPSLFSGPEMLLSSSPSSSSSSSSSYFFTFFSNATEIDILMEGTSYRYNKNEQLYKPEYPSVGTSTSL
jgi:hypothetical protein